MGEELKKVEVEKKIAEIHWKKNTFLFILSQAITLLGSSVVQMAIIWQVTVTTSSGLWVTLLTLSAMIPQAIVSVIGGAYADRYSKKKIIILADLGIALVTLLLVILLLVEKTTYLLPVLLIVSAIRSIASGIQTPTVHAVIPLIVPEKYLLQYNSITSSLMATIQFVAPAIAGSMLFIGQFQWILLIDVITALIGVFFLSFVNIKQRTTESNQEESVIKSIKSGIVFAKKTKNVRNLLLTFAGFIFFSVPSGFLSVLLIQRTFGENYFYLTVNEMLGFAGMVLGGLLLGVWGGFKRRKTTLVIGLVSYGLFSFFLSFTTVFWLFATLMFFISCSIPVIQSVVTTGLQESVPLNKQGRIFGVFGMIYNAIMPLGMLLFGPLADVVTIQWMIAPSGVMLIFLALFVWEKTD